MKIKSVLLTAIPTAVLCISGNVLAYTGSGDGSPGNPYQIANSDDLRQLSFTTAHWSKAFILKEDINLTGVILTPVGDIGNKFTGIFDGDSHIIFNLTINAPTQYYVGLFGYVENCQIKNLGVVNVNITGRYLVGGLAGRNDGGTLTKCFVVGSVNGIEDFVGGLVGRSMDGAITDCYASCSVSGRHEVGGLAGFNGSTLTDCYARGPVSGNWYVGGLVGVHYRTMLTNCYATGSVSGTGSYAGGLVGSNGDVSSDSGTIISCFWDTQTCPPVTVGVGYGPSTGVTGKTTPQMKTLSTFTSAGWDFVNTWLMPANNYPRLAWDTRTVTPPDHYTNGNGSIVNPYQIANVADFQLLSATPTDWDKSFILTADIDLVGQIFAKAPIAPDTNDANDYFQGTQFTGIFDGNGHTISNLTISAFQEYLGLFGAVGEGGQIKNLGVVDVNISGRNYIGGLVARNSGTLTSCYATGPVNGIGYVGGLVGQNNSDSISGSISNCYSTGTVSGSSSVGGLVGGNGSGLLTSCYAAGSVTGTGDSVGGLVGGSMNGAITGCFWDVNTSNQPTSAGGGGVQGKTTAEMMTLATFTAAGWDFTATDGNPPIWKIQENITYPHLFWEPNAVIPHQYPGGTGTSIDPYQIAIIADWQLLMASPADWDKYFIQTADIDMRNIEMTPIGNVAKNFTGSFDGQGYRISNAYIYMPDSDYIGLFGYVGPGGRIKNSGVLNVNITGRDLVGGLVGFQTGLTTTVSNCHASGSVTGTGGFGNGYQVGGLVGYNDSGSIASCYATCSVYGNALVGGLVGVNYGWTGGGTVTSCHATGPVSGNYGSVGGLAGVNWGTLTDCYATGSVSGYGAIGGLVGRNWNTLTGCHATGSVSGSFDVGGLAGLNEPGALITTCHATGSVTGTGTWVGGLVGWNGSTLTDCHATGTVTGTDYVGGLVGMNDYGYGYGKLTSCHAEGPVTGNNHVGSLAGENGGALADCYATGAVTGTGSFVGGLVGNNTGTIVTPLLSGPGILDVSAINNPDLSGGFPPGTTVADFPVGFFEFTVSNIPGGGSTTININYVLPPGKTVNTYYKYGKTAGDTSDHWYEFLWDANFPDQGGAEILSDHIILHLVDGQRGDDDLAANGRIVDPGGPAFIATFGSLQVTLGPAAAVTAGAQWSVDGGTTWNYSGTTVTGLLVGSSTVTYKAVAGWTAPSSESAAITDGATTAISRSYIQQGGYNAWKEAVFTIEAERNDPAISGEQATPAHDGITNLMKYALALEPKTCGTSELPKSSRQAGYLTMTYRKNKQATDLVYTVQATDSLAAGSVWSEASTVVSQTDEGGYWLVTVRDNVAYAEHPSRFMRLRVSH